MIRRAFRYRLEPTKAQFDLLNQFAGTTRFVYNLALEQRRDYWRQHRANTGLRFDFVTQGREVTALRAEVDWIAETPASALGFALRDLDRAFANYFAGRSGHPTPRKKGVRDGFRLKGITARVRRLNSKWATVTVQKIGEIKFRLTRPIRGRIVTVAFQKDALGWHVNFACEIEHVVPANGLPAVGIDRGVVNLLSLSDGSMLTTESATALDKKRRAAQRALARKTKGSRRRAKQRERLSAISAKLARVRHDWSHKASLDVARRFGFVAIEALEVQAMTRRGRRKRGLNRAILDRAWGQFETLLSYKLNERGGRLVKVNPAYTSQECSACGTIDKASRESQASFACRHCGFAGHADTNAAINILRRGTALMRAEEGGCAPVETRTEDHALAA